MEHETEVKQKKENTFKTAEVITLVLTTCVVSLVMGVLLARPSKNDQIELANENIQQFLKEYNYIVDNYYKDVDEKELLDAALAGVIDALGDPYSNAFDEAQSNNFNAKLNGTYQGIGIEAANDKNNQIVIVNVFEKTPAEEAGIKVGDIITTFNGESLVGKTTSEFTELVKNEKQKTIKLGLLRNKKKIEVTLSSGTITLTSVYAKMIEQENKKIGYINVSIFAANTDTQFHKELQKLEKDNIDSLIIDLRGNTGGHLIAVENMISEFLDSSNIIYQIEDKSKTTKHYSKGNITKKYPIVVLVDKGSASASEMMTAALKESYKATVIGMTTYGKGTVQQMQNEENDNLQYKITTKKWLTPKGNWINEVGIKPDIEVPLTIDYVKNPSDATDAQLQKALEYLKK